MRKVRARDFALALQDQKGFRGFREAGPGTFENIRMNSSTGIKTDCMLEVRKLGEKNPDLVLDCLFVF